MSFARATPNETTEPAAFPHNVMPNHPQNNLRPGLVTAGLCITGAVLYALLSRPEFWVACRPYLNAALIAHFMPPVLHTMRGTRAQIGLSIFGGTAIIGLAGLAVIFKHRTAAALCLSAGEATQLAPLPVYGALPTHFRRKPESGVFMDRPQDPFSEAMRAVRDNIYHTHTTGECCVILVTSASASDGKTEIALNLARCLADDGKAAILVDADLRHGPESKLFRTNFFNESAAARHTIAIMAHETGGSTGLADWIETAKIPPFDKYPKQAFHMLPAGPTPANPAELLNHPRLPDVFQTLRQEFDYVVIDSPPLPAVADGLKLACQADIIISVVRPRHTSREDFVKHDDMLGRLEKQRGLILNDTTRAGTPTESATGQNQTQKLKTQAFLF